MSKSTAPKNNKVDSARSRLFHKYKYNAKKRNIKWALTKEEFYGITKEQCHYCGKAPRGLIKDRWKKYECRYSGVDRKSSRRGYTVKNCVPCCSTCNYMKGKMSYRDFLAKVSKIFRFLVK